MLILWLPPNGQNDSSAEDKEQGEESQAPGFQSGNGLDSIRGENTQAQDEERYGGQNRKQSESVHILPLRVSELVHTLPLRVSESVHIPLVCLSSSGLSWVS